MSEKGPSSTGHNVDEGIGSLPVAPPRIPDHELLRCIGEGSYGQVWLARNIMGEPRAVKVVYRRKFREDQHAYEREFKGIRLYEPISRSHESLVPILHIGRDDAAGCFYYVMELADDVNGAVAADMRRPTSTSTEAKVGKWEREKGGSALESSDSHSPTLSPAHLQSPEDQSLLTSAATYEPKTLRSELRRRGRLPAEECVSIGAALGTVLEQLHNHKLVHRDIKPANIIFVHGRPKLADIGLVTDRDASLSFVGTLGYVGPEGPGQPAADIFSLGKVLYEMCMGLDREKFPALPPLDGMSEPERKGLRELNAVILKSCAHDPAQRHRTAGELRKELLALQAGVSIEGQRALERTVARLKRVGQWAALVLLVGAVALAFWIQGQRAVGQARQRELLLRDAQLVRTGERTENWSATVLSKCVAAAQTKLDDAVRREAVTALSGLDAHPIQVHSNRVGSSAAFAPDGRAVVGGWTGRLGHGPGLLIGTNGSLTELPVSGAGPVCWTPNALPLQFVAISNACELREMFTGNLRRRFLLAEGEQVVGDDCPVLAMTSDGSHVAAALAQRNPHDHSEVEHADRVLVWDARTGETLGQLTTPATALAFSPESAQFVVGRKDGNVEFYALPGMTKLLTLEPASGPLPVTCLTLAEDRMMPYETRLRRNRWMLAAGYKGGRVAVWDLDRQSVRSWCHGSVYTVVSLTFLQDGQTLAAGGHNEVRLYDVMTGRTLLTLASSGGSDEGRALASDGSGTKLLWGTIMTGGRPSVGLWELAHHRGIQALRGLASGAAQVWFSPNQKLLAALSQDWHLAVWEIGSGRLRYVFEVPAGMYADNASAAFDATGARLAFATWHEARLYDLATGGVMNQWKLKDGLSDHLQFNERGELLLVRREQSPSAPPGKRTWWRLYELDADRSSKLLLEQTDPNFRTTETLFRFGGDRFIVWDSGTNGTRRTIEAYDVPSGVKIWSKVTAELDGTQPRVYLEPTGHWLLYRADNTAHLRVLRLPDFAETGDTVEHCAAMSPSGLQIVVPKHDEWRIQDREGQRVSLPLGIDRRHVPMSAFSPDERLLAWGTSSGVVMLAEIEAVRLKLESLQRPMR